MKNSVYFILVLAFLHFSVLNSHSGSINFEPGLWKTCTQLELNDIPVPSTLKCNLECLAELKDDKILFPSEEGHVTNLDESDSCDIDEYTISGSTVTWAISCNRDAFPITNGQFKYEGKVFTGRIKAKNPDTGAGISTIFSGNFLTEDCSQKENFE